jgi:iron complex transport system substrate-binding protein
VVPGDADGDMILSDEELELAEKSFDDGKITSEQLDEIRHIHDNYPITIVDSANRTVTIYKPVERVIPMITWSYEPLWILDSQDKVVGVTSNAQKEEEYGWLPGILNKPVVGLFKELDYEKVTELNPDIVIVGSKAEEVEEKLEPAGINVVVLYFRSQETFDSELKILAKLLEKDERADDFISWKKNKSDWIKEKIERIDPKVRVYAEWSDVLWGTGSEGSGMHDVITTAGGYNIASDLQGLYPSVDPEWVLGENPEVIFFPAFTTAVPTALTGYFMESPENAEHFIEEASNRTGLVGTNAVNNRRIYVIDGFCVEAVRGYIGTYYCAKWFYPEEFNELDPEALHKEYFEEWLGVPYQGIWAYPLEG